MGATALVMLLLFLGAACACVIVVSRRKREEALRPVGQSSIIRRTRPPREAPSAQLLHGTEPGQAGPRD